MKRTDATTARGRTSRDRQRNRQRNRRLGSGSVLLVALYAAAALALMAIAALWGYRAQTQAWPIPERASQAATEAEPRGKRPSARGAAAAATNAATVSAEPLALANVPGASASAPNVLTWPIWEFLLRQPIPPRNPPLTPLPWRLMGAAQSAGTWSIIVMRQGKATPEYFKTGESLPGGYRIESITEEDVTLVKGKLPVILSYIGSR